MKRISSFVVTLLFCLNCAAPVAAQSTLMFPVDAFSGAENVVDFGAIPNDGLDDTLAIRAALESNRADPNFDYSGFGKLVYFPPGNYHVSDTLTWNGCCLTLQGAGPGATVIRLADGAAGFGNPQTPKAVVQTPNGNGNDSFRQNIWDLTIDVGAGNPGAVALDWVSNNVGAVRNVLLRAAPDSGAVGLDMTREWPGPCLVRDLRVEGFARGIYVGHPEYGPTLSRVQLASQRVAGIDNTRNTLAIEQLTSVNAVPAIRNLNTTNRASIILVGADLSGGAGDQFAIENFGHLYARNVSTSGYAGAVRTDNVPVPGSTISEYIARGVKTLFASPERSLGLPISDAPVFHDDDPEQWSRVTPSYVGDTAAIQSAMNAGKPTVYFPFGSYFSYHRNVITVPTTVRRIVGLSSFINQGPEGGLVFRVVGDTEEPLIIEQFGYGVSVEHASTRSVVMRHMVAGRFGYVDEPGSGNVYFEDVLLRPMALLHAKQIWARQLNMEGDLRQIDNASARLWILGMKTEGRGQVIRTRERGQTEFLGTLIYPAKPFDSTQQQVPAFENDNAAVSVIFSGSSYVNNGMYPIFVRETRGSVSRDLLRSGNELRLSLYSGFNETQTETNTHTVTSSVGTPAGSISPLGGQSVDDGDTTQFTLTPEPNHNIDWAGGACGGSLVGNIYTTSAISADCTVVANFAIDTFTLTYTAGSGGSISGTTPQTVDYGTDSTLVTAVPDANNHFVGWSDGVLTASRTDTNVMADISVTAYFEIDTHTVTSSVGTPAGSISPLGGQSVDDGDTTQFTLTPKPNHNIDWVGGTCGGSLVGNIYTTSAISADCVVIANFTNADDSDVVFVSGFE